MAETLEDLLRQTTIFQRLSNDDRQRLDAAAHVRATPFIPRPPAAARSSTCEIASVPQSPATLRAAAAYGVLGLPGFLVQMVVAMQARILPLVSWFWAYARTGYRVPPPSPHVMRDRSLQAIVFVAGRSACRRWPAAWRSNPCRSSRSARSTMRSWSRTRCGQLLLWRPDSTGLWRPAEGRRHAPPYQRVRGGAQPAAAEGAATSCDGRRSDPTPARTRPSRARCPTTRADSRRAARPAWPGQWRWSRSARSPRAASI